jgi:uncharacterized FlaG/YvyC family protein
MPLINKLYYSAIRFPASISAQSQTHLTSVLVYKTITIRHKSTIEKTKEVAHDANLKAGKKLSKAIGTAEHIADVAEKADHLKKQIKHEVDHDLNEKVINASFYLWHRY